MTEKEQTHAWYEFAELNRLLLAGDYQAYRKKCIELGIIVVSRDEKLVDDKDENK
jgi:hypothetical protein